VALLPVLKIHVYRLPEHVVEDLENLLGHKGIFVRELERVIASLPRQCEGECPSPLRRRKRSLHHRVYVLKREAHDHVLRSQDYRQSPLEIRAHIQRRQGPFADDNRVHELHRDMLCVGRGRAVPERQQPATRQEPAGHLVASLGEARAL
jgi:hypothetical protein